MHLDMRGGSGPSPGASSWCQIVNISRLLQCIWIVGGGLGPLWGLLAWSCFSSSATAAAAITAALQQQEHQEHQKKQQQLKRRQRRQKQQQRHSHRAQPQQQSDSSSSSAQVTAAAAAMGPTSGSLSVSTAARRVPGIYVYVYILYNL